MEISPDEKMKLISRVFNIGMHYIQKGIKLQGYPHEQQKCCNKFINICRTAATDMAGASIPSRERALSLINLVNEDRIRLNNALFEALEDNNDEAVQKIMQAQKIVMNTCAYVNKCYEKNVNVPKLKTVPLTFSKLVINPDIDNDCMFFNIESITGDLERTYQLKVIHPIETTTEHTTAFFKPGSTNIQFNMSEFTNIKAAKIKNGKIHMELISRRQRIFGSRDKVVATFDLRLNEFAEKATFSQEVTFVNTAKDDHRKYAVKMTVKVHTALEKPEVKTFVINIHQVPKDAKVPNSLPLSTPIPDTSKIPAPQAVQAKPPQKLSGGQKVPQKAAASAAAQKRHIQPLPIPEIHILEEWEWQRFMPAEVLQFIHVQATTVESIYGQHGRDPPPELIAQKNRAEATMDKLMERVQGGELSEDGYKALIVKAIKDDEAKAKELAGTPGGDELGKRIGIMRKELAGME